MILFDVGVPHQTVRGDKETIRVSFDLRLRREDPYSIIDERWSQPLTPLRKYWQLPGSGTPATFAARAQTELNKLAGRYLAAQAREREIDRLREV